MFKASFNETRENLLFFSLSDPSPSLSSLSRPVTSTPNAGLPFTTNLDDWILPKKSAEAFDNLLQSTSQIVFDTDISNIIDGELAVIENDKYEDIEKMILSTDIDNRSLAVEMMANCNIEKSFDVVSGLYYWKYDWFKSTNNWNSVNVKAMRNRLKAYEGVHNTSTIYSFNNYLSLLAKDRKLTRFAVDRSRQQLLNTLLGPIVGDSSDIFKVDLDNLYIVDKIEENINE